MAKMVVIGEGDIGPLTTFGGGEIAVRPGADDPRYAAVCGASTLNRRLHSPHAASLSLGLSPTLERVTRT